MFRALKRRALSALAVGTVVAVGLAGTSNTVALADGTVAPYWGDASTLGAAGSGLLAGVDCTSSTSCVAVGEARTSGSLFSGLPEVVAESGGQWGTPEIVGITGAASTDGGYLSVSCMSADSCVGVGYNSDTGYEPIAGPISVSGSAVTANPAALLTLPSVPATASPEDGALASVSCTATGCTAVGFYQTNSASTMEPMVATLGSGGLWSTATVAPPSAATHGAELTAVSCPSSGACEAVGTYLNGSDDAEIWSVQLGGGTPHTLTLPSGAVTATSTLPQIPEELNEEGDELMSAISCPGTDACTAVAQYPVGGGLIDSAAISINNGTPGAAVALPAQSGLAYTEVGSLWCSDASDCAADGNVLTSGNGSIVVTPVTMYEVGGTWAMLATLPGGAPSATGEAIALGLGCSTIDSCLAVGLQATGTLTTFTPIYDFSAPLLTVTTASLPAATTGVPYSASLQGTGGHGAGGWSIKGALPAGLTLNTATGVISGTPTTPGTDSFTVQLASAGPPSQTASAELTITVGAAPVTTPPATPATPAAPAAAPKLSSGPAKVTANGIMLSLGCSGSGTCSGKAVVTAVEHLKGRRVTAVTARAKKRKLTITLARGSYSLSAGQLGTIDLRLTAQAKALLGKLHTIKGRLTLTPTGAGKPTLTRTVTFKSPARKK